MDGGIGGRVIAGRSSGNTEKCGKKGAQKGSLLGLPQNSLSTSTGRWPIMAERRRVRYLEQEEPTESSGERERARSTDKPRKRCLLKADT